MEVPQRGELALLAEVRDRTRSGEARRLRQAAAVTLDEIGKAVGVRRSTIHRWETGQQRPTGESALRYARVLRQLQRQERHS